MKKMLFVLSLLMIGGVSTTQAVLSPEQTTVTIRNQSSRPIADIRFKVLLNGGKGSVHIKELAAGETRSIDLMTASKKLRKEVLPGQKKGDVVGNKPAMPIGGRLTNIEIVKIYAQDANKKRLFRNKLISQKKQIHKTENSTADTFIVNNTSNGGIEIIPAL